MQLADHSDAATHMLYVRATDVLIAPEGMMPKINSPRLEATLLPSDLVAHSQPPEFLRARKDSNLRPSASEADTLSS
jgi:hypothetical protein